jgi:hypothetical protein
MLTSCHHLQAHAAPRMTPFALVAAIKWPTSNQGSFVAQEDIHRSLETTFWRGDTRSNPTQPPRYSEAATSIFTTTLLSQQQQQHLYNHADTKE